MKKSIDDLLKGITMTHQCVSFWDDENQNEMTKTALSGISLLIVDLAESFDLPSAEKEKTLRTRTENQAKRIRMEEIERELIEVGQTLNFKEVATSLEERIEKIWVKQGFRSLDSFSFNKYGHLLLEFSLRPGGKENKWRLRKYDLTLDEATQIFESHDFQLNVSERSRLLANVSNVSRLEQLVSTIFPGAEVTNYTVQKDGIFFLNNLFVTIKDLEDLEELR